MEVLAGSFEGKPIMVIYDDQRLGCTGCMQQARPWIHCRDLATTIACGKQPSIAIESNKFEAFILSQVTKKLT